MTLTEAIGHARTIVRENADTSNTREGTLSPREVEAIDKLITTACEALSARAAIQKGPRR